MKNIATILAQRIKELDSASKFTLLTMTVVQSGNGCAQMGIEDWARSLAVPAIDLGAALRALVTEGLVDVVVVPGKGRGRPRHEYRWGPAYLERLPKDKQSHGTRDQFIPLIADLVRNAGASKPKAPPRRNAAGKRVAPSRLGAGTVLNRHNRMVLAVLLAFADGGGVVRGMGAAELAALSGMRPSRFETNIAKLMAMGFIRAYVPGASGAPLLGIVKGAYFLNLGHPQYGGEATPSLAYALPTNRALLEYSDRRDDDIRQLIWSAGRSIDVSLTAIDRSPLGVHFARLPGATKEKVHRLVGILVGAGQQGLGRHLQHVLEKHASRVLTGHSGEERIVRLDPSQLSKEVIADVYPARRREKKLDSEDAIAAIELLASYIAVRAIEMADYCHLGLREFEMQGLPAQYGSRKPDHFEVLPWIPGTTSQFIVVVSSYSKTLVESHASFFLMPVKQRYSDEAKRSYFEFETETVWMAPFHKSMYQHGLFTRTKKKLIPVARVIVNKPVKVIKKSVVVEVKRPLSGPKPLV